MLVWRLKVNEAEGNASKSLTAFCPKETAQFIQVPTVPVIYDTTYDVIFIHCFEAPDTHTRSAPSIGQATISAPSSLLPDSPGEVV